MGMKWLDRFLYGKPQEERSLTWPYPHEMFTYSGHQYWGGGRTSYGGREEPDLYGGEGSAITSNGTVYGIVRTRVDLFAQAKFCWKRLGSGSMPMSSDLFTLDTLSPVDHPAKMLEWCELDVAAAGNSYWVSDNGKLRRLPPQWCTIVLGSQRYPDNPGYAWDSEPIGLIYLPTGRPADEAETFLWSEVAHYCPEQDPDARFRGMSYLRPAMEDISSDNGARRYLTKFFRNNATPNMAVVFPPEITKEVVEAYRDFFLEKHQGVERAFRTAFLGAGADLKVVGVNLKDLDTEHVRNQIHRDIATAAGINPMAIGLLQVNYNNTKEGNRSLSDRKLRYLWLNAVEAFRPLIGPAPARSELWYDVAGISALQADAIDEATVMQTKLTSMEIGIRAGLDPKSVIAAVSAGDVSKVNHTGLVSVQLQTPGSVEGLETRSPRELSQAAEPVE